MNTRTQTLVFVDIVISILLIISFFSGVLLWLIVPKGGGSVFLLPRHSWSDIHLVSSLLFGMFTAVHIGLHWTYITHCIFNKKYGKTNYSQ